MNFSTIKDHVRHDTVMERNDCTVTAFTIVSDRSYMQCHEVMRRVAGRRTRMAISDKKFLPKVHAVAQSLGIKMVYCKGSGTLQKFLSDHQVGTYFVKRSGHVFAIRDGIVFDRREQSPLCRILFAWRIVEPETGVEPATSTLQKSCSAN